ncbi:MAG: hypothetical protein MHM6MM_008554 [Cercozoa sp. M6MM]
MAAPRALLSHSAIKKSVSRACVDFDVVVEECVLRPVALQPHVIGAKVWRPRSGNGDLKRVLCAHGWQDSAGTFDFLAPRIAAEMQAQVVCFDFLGHGRSSHHQNLEEYDFPRRLMEIEAVTQALEWSSFTYVGHSMGGAVGMLYAAVFPEKVDDLVCIDAFGPWVMPLSPVALMRMAVDMRMNHYAKGGKKQRRPFDSIDAMAAHYGKATGVPADKAAHIVARAAIQQDGQVCFGHDRRLVWPTMRSFSAEDSKIFATAVRCPTLVLVASDESRKRPRSNEEKAWMEVPLFLFSQHT